MAIKVNNTTVINDSRALQNISSVDAATVTALENAGVGGGSTWVTKTSNYTASAGDKIMADTSGGAFTITMPSSPSTGDVVYIIDVGRTWIFNSLTLSASGKTFTDQRGTDSTNTRVYDISRYLECIYTAAGKWYVHLTISGEFATNMFLPDWVNPDITLTGSGTWTPPTTYNDNDCIVITLIGGGDSGAAQIFSGQTWAPGGNGGQARVILTTVGAFRGASYSCGAGKTPSGGSWQRGVISNPTTFTSSDQGNITYTTELSGVNNTDNVIGYLHPGTEFSVTSPSQVFDNDIKMTELTVEAVVLSNDSINAKFGDRILGNTQQGTTYANGPAVFSGGNGRSVSFGTTSAAGTVSAYAGNGGSNFGSDGTAPGGGGGGPTSGSGNTGGDGAAGAILIYNDTN